MTLVLSCERKPYGHFERGPRRGRYREGRTPGPRGQGGPRRRGEAPLRNEDAQEHGYAREDHARRHRAHGRAQRHRLPDERGQRPLQHVERLPLLLLLRQGGAGRGHFRPRGRRAYLPDRGGRREAGLFAQRRRAQPENAAYAHHRRRSAGAVQHVYDDNACDRYQTNPDYTKSTHLFAATF